MSIVGEEIIEVEGKTNRGRIRLRRKKILKLKCDECQAVYIAPYYSVKRAFKSEHHFCSKPCSTRSHSSGLLKEKREATNVERYGATCFAASTVGREKLNEVMIEKFGTISPLALPEIREKIKKTFLEKYGSETFAGTPEHQAQLDRREIAHKAWQTKIKNGTCSQSKPEERVYKILSKKYGSDLVQRQVKTIGQWVDFQITEPNYYLQVDGVYWHGLNRKLKEIRQQKTTQDVKIYKQILRDRKLNRYMASSGLKMVRLTDDEINSRTDEEIIQLIEERLK